MVAPRRAAYAEEAAEVEVLYANLEKMKSLSKKIQGSMSRLEISGRTVQDAIGPVYGNTKRLQTTTANVDRVLAAIEKAKEPLDMRNKEERLLRSRPDQVGLNEFLASFDRTFQAFKGLKTSNLRSNQKAIAEVDSLLKAGTKSLEDVFRDILRSESQSIEPVKQLTTNSPFPRLSSAKTAQLRAINAHVAEYAQFSATGDVSPCARCFALERGQYLTISLQNLASACLSTARKINAEATYKAGSNAIGSYTQGIEGMYTAEYENICPIFSRDEWGPVLQATCQMSLNAFASTLKELDNHVKHNLLTDCFLAYEIIDVVSNTSVQLENQTGELKHAISDALKPVRETAKASLSVLLNEIRMRVQPLQALPLDGGPLPITTDVMKRLQLLTGYLAPLSSIMRSLGAGGWATPDGTTSNTSVPTIKSFDVGADGKQLFAQYSMDTVETLLNNLDGAARRLLRGKSLQGVFMANNINIVDRMIRNSDLEGLLSTTQGKLDVWRRRATQMYTDAWKETSLLLLDTIQTSHFKGNRPSSTGQGTDSAAMLRNLSSKEKDVIKEKFRNFNMSFDDLASKHKAFRMEPEVRRMLGREVSSLIGPLYQRFWERYHEVDKGKGKYVKYDSHQLTAVLATLG